MDILWVEDEQHILGLDEIADKANLNIAISCADAIRKLNDNKYDLLIIDLIIPISTGPESELNVELLYDNELEKKYSGAWLIRFIRENMKINTSIIVLTIVVGEDREPLEDILSKYITEYISKYEIMPDDLFDKISNLVK